MSSSEDSSASDSDRVPAGRPLRGKRLQAHLDMSRSDSESENDAGDPSDSDSDGVPAAAEEVEEITVQSHAERRRQKKKEQKVAAKSEEDAASSRPAKVKNTAELKPSKVPKRQNSVWVGNMTFKTTPDSLRKFFDGVGEITRVHMPMKLASSGPGGKGAVKENRGFAYVDFATPDAKTLAITLSENPLDGRRLLIKDGGDFSGRPSTSKAEGDADASAAKSSGTSKTAQKILRSQKQPAGPTLFLGNLGFATTEQSIRDMLTSHRKIPEENELSDEKDKWIRKIRMGTFEDSGKCKGWAFVDFTTTENATAALTNPKNYFLDGRKLVVEYASPEAVRRGGAGPRPKREDKEKKSQDQGAAPVEAAVEVDTDSRPQKRRGERVRPTRKRDVDGDMGEGESEQPAKRRRMEDSGSREAKSNKYRAKPGAALAMAKRETTSIVPSQGKKIVF